MLPTPTILLRPKRQGGLAIGAEAVADANALLAQGAGGDIPDQSFFQPLPNAVFGLR